MSKLLTGTVCMYVYMGSIKQQCDLTQLRNSNPMQCLFNSKLNVNKVYLNLACFIHIAQFQSLIVNREPYHRDIRQLLYILTFLCSLLLSGCNRGFGSPHERCYQTYTDADTGGETSSLFLYPKLSVSFTQSLACVLFFLFCLPHTCTHITVLS